MILRRDLSLILSCFLVSKRWLYPKLTNRLIFTAHTNLFVSHGRHNKWAWRGLNIQFVSRFINKDWINYSTRGSTSSKKGAPIFFLRHVQFFRTQRGQLSTLKRGPTLPYQTSRGPYRVHRPFIGTPGVGLDHDLERRGPGRRAGHGERRHEIRERVQRLLGAGDGLGSLVKLRISPPSGKLLTLELFSGVRARPKW